jgi:hypothetical protein
MPLPTTTIDLAEDPLRIEDLVTHARDSTGSMDTVSCPNCGRAIRDHNDTEDTPEHEHRLVEDRPLCRRLWECNNRTSVSAFNFYTYQDLDTTYKWVVAPVVESLAEVVDDTDIISFGRKKLAEPIKPTWRFKTKLATKVDYTDYLSKNLDLGLEMEFDFKDTSRPITDSVVTRVFGVHPSEYHHHPECPVCGSSSCWNHMPENLIRGIERDASINGWEFLVYAGNFSSEEFVRRLPLAKMREYFVANERDGLHIHAMINHDIAKLPNVIVRNLWQLFRYYYPAWVYLFGNYSNSQGFLRRSSYNGHDYVTFTTFNKSPFSSRWAKDITNRDHARCGLFLMNTPVAQEELTTFDIEIRTSDASMDMEQIVALRAITRAEILRASQLSNYGLLSVETDAKMWETIKTVVGKINTRAGVTNDEYTFMRKHTEKLLKELTPFLTEFERDCIRHLIDRPVRERENRFTTANDLMPDISDNAKHLKKLITVSTIEADSEDEWLRTVARLMGINMNEAKNALRQLKAYWVAETKQMVLVG